MLLEIDDEFSRRDVMVVLESKKNKLLMMNVLKLMPFFLILTIKLFDYSLPGVSDQILPGHLAEGLE